MIPLWVFALMALGLAALVWGVVSLRRKKKPEFAEATVAPATKSRPPTSQIREIIAIIGGVISIIVGLLTILEKLNRLTS